MYPQGPNQFFGYTRADMKFLFQESNCELISILHYCLFAIFVHLDLKTSCLDTSVKYPDTHPSHLLS